MELSVSLGLLDMGGGVSDLFSKVVEWALQGTSEITSNDGAESSSSNRELVDSNKRLGLSDASGNASRLLSKTGNTVHCSS